LIENVADITPSEKKRKELGGKQQRKEKEEITGPENGFGAVSESLKCLDQTRKEGEGRLVIPCEEGGVAIAAAV